MADNSYFGLLKHTCNHVYHLIYQYKLCFFPRRVFTCFVRFWKWKASGHRHILGSARMKPVSLNWRKDMVSVMETKCFLWSINWIFKRLLGKNGACKAVPWLGQLFTGLSSRRPRSISVSPCEICGERSSTGTGFCLSASVYLCRYHTNSPTLHTHLHQKG